MALRRRDFLIVCIVALVAWLWTTHFLPSLRLLPYALTFGCLGTLATFTWLIGTTSRAIRIDGNAELPPSSFLGISSYVATWRREQIALVKRAKYQPLRIPRKSSLIARRIDELLYLIWRDFLKSWYSRISAGDRFADELDRATRTALDTAVETALLKDLVELGVTRVLPIINGHFKAVSEAERQVRGKRLNIAVTDTSELDIAIASRYRDGNLHPAASLASTKTQAMQQQYLRRLTSRIMQAIMPLSMQSSKSVMILVREIVTCAILSPIISTLSDPDVLNQLVESYGRTILQERNDVRKLRAALDEHTTKSPSTGTRFPRLVRGDNERAFEKFIRAIRQCSSLSDARRFRNEIILFIKRETTSQPPDATFLRRLEVGRRLLDQRISEMSLQPKRNSESTLNGTNANAAKRDTSNVSLRQLLYDAAGLSYFMEFMDRLNLVSLVQFWIVVDGMRGPLEREQANGNEFDAVATWTKSDREDLAQISRAYFGKPELQVPNAISSAVATFLNGKDDASFAQFNEARGAVLSFQEVLYENMQENYYPKFQESDLFFKWLAVDAPAEGRVAKISRRSLESAHSENFLQTSNLNPERTDLRRAAMSSSDLLVSAKVADDMTAARRSLEITGERRPLFDDAIDSPAQRSTQSLSSTNEISKNDQNNMMSAVQAALDDIVDEHPQQEQVFETWRNDVSNESATFDFQLETSDDSQLEKGKPSLSSLGLLADGERRTVFSEGDLFGENENMWEEDTGEVDERQIHEEDIQEAAPGDLGLSEVVESLTLEIEKLEAQQAVVDTLTRKAELTNNAAELRILRKSQSSLEREIHRKELQRQQYIVQRSENDLFGKANISIKKIMIGNESDGREFAMYVIEVERVGSEKIPVVTWAIARRYSEFHELHRRLRKRYPSVSDLEFPRRQMMLTLQKDFLKRRSAALQKYLRELLNRPQVCRSIEFRAFLSQQTIQPIANSNGQVDKQDIITRIYNSVTDGMEDFIGNVPVLDQLSTAGQNLITAAVASVPTTPKIEIPQVGFDSRGLNSGDTAEARAEIAAFESKQDPETTTFIKPICDLLVELFHLNQGNNWLRGRAVVVVTQQLLGGTIERKVREAYKAATTEDSLCRGLDIVKDMLWPDGKFRTSPPERSHKDKETSRRNAEAVLTTLLPDMAGAVVGRGNAAAAGRRMLATFNNERLNLHLMCTLLDEIVDGLFGIRITK